MGAKMPVSLYTDIWLDLEEGWALALLALSAAIGLGKYQLTDELRTWEQGCQGRRDRGGAGNPLLGEAAGLNL